VAHPLGIPRITLVDYEQYNDMKAWANAQNWETKEEMACRYLREAHERQVKLLTRPAFNHGLYGKDYTHRRKDD